MLKLVIKYKVNKNNVIKLTLLDNLNILPFSFKVLTKDYVVYYLKGFFYSFVNSSTLNYVGPTPNIEYYKNMSKYEYKKKYMSNNWSLKENSYNNIRQDILSLL
jgi:hypothetical protein